MGVAMASLWHHIVTLRVTQQQLLLLLCLQDIRASIFPIGTPADLYSGGSNLVHTDRYTYQDAYHQCSYNKVNTAGSWLGSAGMQGRGRLGLQAAVDSCSSPLHRIAATAAWAA